MLPLWLQHALALATALGAAVFLGRQWVRGLGSRAAGCAGCAFAPGAPPAPAADAPIPASSLVRRDRAKS